jgi:serine/threonine protein kinase
MNALDTPIIEIEQDSPGSVTSSSKALQAYQEYCARLAQGELVDPDEFCGQLSTGRTQLAKLIQLHLYLEANSSLLSDPASEVTPLLATNLAPELWPKPGMSFLGFDLLEELGRGSFARVFLAEEPKLGKRRVAVKLALGGGAEAKILGQLKHANVVPVHSVQEDAATGLTAVCMSFVGRTTLEDVLDSVYTDGKVPAQAHVIFQNGTYVDGVAHLGAQLADALAYIHELGVYHRDLKPSNVLLSPAGVPMLLDFNLSTETVAAEATGQLARLGGTLPYMAPEQLQAFVQGGSAPVVLDGRADIFSLGVMLYELLTGRHPFGPVELKTPGPILCQQLLERQQRPPVRVSDLNPEVGRDLSALILRCLAHDRAARPQAAAEMARLLRVGLSPHRRARRWLSRRKWSVAAVASLLVAAAVGAAIVVAQLPSAQEWKIATAESLATEGKFAEAVELYAKALETKPRDAALYFARARAYQQMGKVDPANYRLAIQDYEQAELLEPNGRNLACMGYCYNLLGGHSKEAKGFYERAHSAGFYTAEVANNLGYTHVQLRQYPLARKNLDEATALHNKSGTAFHNRALACLLDAAAKMRVLETWSNSKGEKKILLCKKLRVEIEGLLQLGMGDLEAARRLGSSSAEFEFNAACLYGEAMRFDPKWVDSALEHLQAAIDKGMDASQALGDVAFDPVRNDPRFQKLLNAPASQTRPAPLILIVDPIT